jgi:hypothetical protein
MARTPKLGGELPAYNTMGAKPKKTRMAFPNPLASTGSGKTVQRAPRENLGTPGTSKFVQRTPGGAHQRKPGMAGLGRVMSTIRTKLSAPRKPAK